MKSIPPNKVKDHSVSGDHFDIVWNQDLHCFQTLPLPSDLGYYYQSENYISHNDDGKSAIDKVYQFVKKFMLRRKLTWIRKQGSIGGTLLDYGCGTGAFIQYASSHGFKSYGIEPNEKANLIATQKGLTMLSDLKNTELKFDVITLWHVLEHVSDPKSLLIQLERVLKPNGMLVIAVPNYTSWDASYYKDYWAGYDVPRHLWHFNPTAVKKVGMQTGFRCVKEKPMLFDSYYVALLSEKYKDGFLKILNAFLVGTYSNLNGCFSKNYSSHAFFFKKTN